MERSPQQATHPLLENLTPDRRRFFERQTPHREKLIDLRVATRGLPMKQIAEWTGISEACICQFLNGINPLDPRRVNRLTAVMVAQARKQRTEIARVLKALEGHKPFTFGRAEGNHASE